MILNTQVRLVNKGLPFLSKWFEHDFPINNLEPTLQYAARWNDITDLYIGLYNHDPRSLMITANTNSEKPKGIAFFYNTQGGGESYHNKMDDEIISFSKGDTGDGKQYQKGIKQYFNKIEDQGQELKIFFKRIVKNKLFFLIKRFIESVYGLGVYVGWFYQ